MNKTKIAKVITIVLIICCIALFSFIMIILRSMLEEEQISDNDTKIQDSQENIENSEDNKQTTLEEVFEKNDVELLSIKDNVIRVVFPKDLYEEDGSSNETFFNNLINEVKPFYVKKGFVLLDPTANIGIDVIYNQDNENYEVKINDLDNYYEQVDGNLYAEVEKSSIKDSSNIISTNRLLDRLSNNKCYFSSIEGLIEEDEELENGYISYNNGQIMLRKTVIGTVRHIIFTSKYEGEINKNINMNTSLSDILEEYPQNAFGSVDEGYLGYISNDFYYFFYDDEISIYSYSYSENKQFEKLLKNYINSKDLDKFVSGIKKNYRVYDYLEYDPEIKKAYILFSNRGIEVDIEENNPDGITLYNNYNFSDVTKKYVREGIIKLNSYEDLVNKMEKERRK